MAAKQIERPFARYFGSQLCISWRKKEKELKRTYNIVGQDLRAICHCQTRPRGTSNTVEDENHRDNSASSALVSGLSVNSRATRPDAEGDQHAYTSDEEEFSASKAVHELGHDEGDEETPDLEAAVDERLVVGALDADRAQDVVEIVRH